MVQLFPIKTEYKSSVGFPHEVVKEFIVSPKFETLYPDNTEKNKSKVLLGLLHSSADNLLYGLGQKIQDYDYLVSTCRMLTVYADNLLKNAVVKQYWVKAIAQSSTKIIIKGINSSYDELVSDVQTKRIGSEFLFRFDINCHKQIVFIDKVYAPKEDRFYKPVIRKVRGFVDDYLKTFQGYDPYFNEGFASTIVLGYYLAINNNSDYIVYRDFNGYNVVEYLKFYTSPFLRSSQLKAVCNKSGNIELEN